jgi:uncharacterized protein (TIGR00251 family)
LDKEPPLIVKVKVKPNSRVEEVVEMSRGELEVKVKAPPEKGKANKRLVEVLARHYGVPPSRVKILKGHTSRTKLVEIET